MTSWFWLPAVGWYASPGLPASSPPPEKKPQRRFLEFFTAKIRNRGIRRPYAGASIDFFRGCNEQPLDLHHSDPIFVAA
ncbi:MAG: hypothetical protein ACE5JI_12950 [Acidobacteriota bacterium]